MLFIHPVSMKFVIVLSSVLCLVDCYYSISFEKNNKCGCNLEYTCANCAPCEKYKPICTQNKTIIEDFRAYHLESCNQWFLEGYNVELVNNIDGTITVTLLFSKLEREERYEIELWILRDSSNNIYDNVSAPMNHSTKTLRVTRRKADSSCRLMVSFNFTFLYSGTYQLSVVKKTNLIEPGDNVSSACVSKDFNISSLYKKKSLIDMEPSFLYVHRPQSNSLVTTVSGDGLNLAKKVYIRFSLCGETNVVMESHLKELFFITHFGYFSTGLHPYSTVVKLKSNIDLSLNDCSGSGNEVAKYIMRGNDGICCDSYGVNQSLEEDCPCQFSDNFQKLSCTLKNLTNGNYCIVVGFYDPRCKPSTVWTQGATAFCMWSYNNITLKGIMTSDKVTYVERLSYWSIFLLFLLVLFSVICAAIVLCWFRPKCIKKLRHGINNYASTSSSESSTISWLKKDNSAKILNPEVLLLYPRDCFPFMNAMTEFRSYLLSNNFKVYDPWDEKIYNTVVESCETWSLQFIKNENVKIILVISDCSKRFEKAFLENTVLDYKEPHTLDVIFKQSFAMIHQYFSNRFDTYKRIFVMQLEGSPPMNFDFITPGTLYSIPKNIAFLIRDLREKETNSPLIEYRLSALMDALADYKYYRKGNLDYLNNLLTLRSESASARINCS